MLERSGAKRTGPVSDGSPSTHTVRSLSRGESWIPSAKFHASERPSAAVPTPADQRHDVMRSW